MRNLRLAVAYDGTNYAGWQRQANALAVQQVLEQAFAPLVPRLPMVPSIAGASRTDAGVHARRQIASVRIDLDLETGAIHRALNVRLPGDVRVLSVDDADMDFHARFDARGKAYRYRLSLAPVPSPFDRWFVWHVPFRCDVDAMRRAAAALVGRHDFSSFQGRGSAIVDPIRSIRSFAITQAGDEIVVDVEGDGFLRHMVRTVVGSLVEIGGGLRPVEWMGQALLARDRRAAGPTAPAKGLTLLDVMY
jgi:tRNA pseudouridine38-40 synthase